MMRSVFLVSNTLFWTAVVALWSGPLWPPEQIDGPDAAAAERAITLAEVARHAKPGDCWMAIDGQGMKAIGVASRSGTDASAVTRAPRRPTRPCEAHRRQETA